MTTKKAKRPPQRPKYVKKTITANAPNYEIRSYFIDTMIELAEYLKDREYNKQIRDKDKEKIRVSRVNAIGNVCNIGLRALKDRQLDEYEKELIELKQGLIIDADGVDVIELSPSQVSDLDELEFKFEKLKEAGASDGK